jgi:hypothetical protein
MLLMLLNASSTSRIALCHRPSLNSKAVIDIITQLAICASQDWKQVNRIVSKFVTASQAQRKWYTRVISMVSNGDYKLGALSFSVFLLFSFAKISFYIQNSANIIVQKNQNRITG